MYAPASGTWQEVSPMSTSTVPSAFATAFAFAVSGATNAPTAMTKLFIAYRTRFGALPISAFTRPNSLSTSARSRAASGLIATRLP